ncbi:MAG: hypothetical protein NVS2B17_26530 [Candidatus Velthaea sp.]
MPLAGWNPVLPEGDLRFIYLHWTAADYRTVFPAYHFCLSGAEDVLVHATHDLRENMRDIVRAPHLPYAAHTAGRNSYAIGIAVCAMEDATPSDFGSYPITPAQIAAACAVAARLAAHYGIAPAAVRTHAEAALDDEYFGASDEDLRWDIARFEPAGLPLDPSDARRCGEYFRAHVAAALA